MNILEDLQSRGLIFQMTHPDELTKSLQLPLSLYCGFDPTAESLHVGNLVPVIALERFQRAGHTPIALIGGATGLIGDPSGKQVERILKEPEQIEQFAADLTIQLKSLLGEDLPVVNNADWFRKMSTIDFLRDVGKHFSVNAMIQRESVKQR
ncbi:MAG: tyrosine--tRNA ligase, partial [Pseudomonadota bacterium]